MFVTSKMVLGWHDWHKQCRKPDVKIVDGIPYCLACGQLAAQDDERLLSESPSSNIPQPLPSNQLNLSWPRHFPYVEENYSHVSCEPVSHYETRNEGSSANLVHRPPSISSSPHPFYTPLTGDNIRLVILSKGESQDPLHIKLKESAQNTDNYEALSYTWANAEGDRERREILYIGKGWHILKITDSCSKALHRLRYSNKPRTLWIDAISINQEDQTERTHQITLMRHIYSCASQVIIYPGDRQRNVEIRPSAVCDLPYFSRVWVIQEIACSRKATVLYNTQEWAWDAFYRETRWDGRLTWLMNFDRSAIHDSMRLYQLLLDTVGSESSDARDKIYALFGLIASAPGDGLVADYSIDLHHVYIGVTSFLLSHCWKRNKPEIFWNILYAATILKLENGPSWVPDWSQRYDIAQWREWEGSSSYPFLGEMPSTPCATAITKQTATLILQAIRVTAMEDLFQVKNCDGLYVQFLPEVRFIRLSRNIQDLDPSRDGIYYLPQAKITVLVRASQIEPKQVTGTLISVCDISDLSMSSDALEAMYLSGLKKQKRMNPSIPNIYVKRQFPCAFPKHYPGISEIIIMNKDEPNGLLKSWMLGLLKAISGGKSIADDTLSPWECFQKSWELIRPSSSKDRRCIVRLLFRKAIFYHQTKRILQLLCEHPRNKGLLGHHPSIVQAVAFHCDNLHKFTEDGLQLLRRSTFLQISPAIWDLTMIRWRPEFYELLGESTRRYLFDLFEIAPISEIKSEYLGDLVRALFAHLLIDPSAHPFWLPRSPDSVTPDLRSFDLIATSGKKSFPLTEEDYIYTLNEQYKDAVDPDDMREIFVVLIGELVGKIAGEHPKTLSQIDRCDSGASKMNDTSERIRSVLLGPGANWADEGRLNSALRASIDSKVTRLLDPGPSIGAYLRTRKAKWDELAERDFPQFPYGKYSKKVKPHEPIPFQQTWGYSDQPIELRIR